jgi:hypothetical protein
LTSPTPFQWLIYSAATGPEKSFTHEVAKEFAEFNTRCARALTLAPSDLKTKTESLVAAARRCIDSIDRINAWTTADIDRFDWRCLTLAARVLDRILAALGIAAFTAAEAVHEDFMPYSNVMKHGVNILQMTLSVLVSSTARDRSKTLLGSGTLAEVFTGTVVDPLSVYGVSGRNSDQFKFLCSGIIADCVDLLTDLCAISTLPASNISTCSFEWACAFPNIQLTDRRYWKIGDVLSAERFAIKLGVSVTDIINDYDSNKLLAFPWFDGTPLFPAVQIDPATNLPYRDLANLLETIDFAKCPPIALSSWLGQDDPSQRMLRMKMLGLNGGLSQIWLQLRGRGVMKQIDFLSDGTPVWAVQKVSVPDVTDIQSIYSQGMFGKLDGSLAYFQSLLSGSAIPPTKAIHRIVSREYTPFYFSQVSTKGGGRFDLPSSGTRGTCYCADSVDGAITEIYGQMLLVDIQAILVRLICGLRNFDLIDELLDISAANVANALKLSSDFVTTMDRASTQEFADSVNTANFRGIIYTLKTRFGSRGYAIFGVSGCAEPENSGLGGWSVEVSRVGDSDAFWQWIQYQQTNNAPDAVLIMPNQLPLKSID